MNNIQQARTLLLYILILLPTGISRSQELSASTYTSEKLQDIAKRLYTDYQIDCNNAAATEVDGLVITTRKDMFGKITHIGFKLFSDELAGQSPSIAYPFIERYLLDLYLLKDESTIIQQMEEDKVHFHFSNTIQKNNLRERLALLIPMLNRSRSFAINTESNTYTVICKDSEDNLFEVRFPSNYQLLSGMNKKECELSFYASLLSFTYEVIPTAPPCSLEEIGRNCYVQRGETYQIEAMNTNRYYSSRDGALEQLTDTIHAKESIHNLFTLQADKRIGANVTLRLYGQKKIEFSISLHKLLEFCKANGCKIFAGIESADISQVKGTAILLNPTDGYNHLLAFKVNPKVLDQPEEYKVEVNLNTFIPNHNIEALFYENKQTERKQ